MRNMMKMAPEITIMPPTVPPMAGPIMELEDTIRDNNLETVKLTEMLIWQSD